MTSARPSIVFLRSPSNPDPYVAAFVKAGWGARCEPALDFRFPYQDELRARLRRPSDYDGLIATSPRAGEALRRVQEDTPGVLTAWQEKRAYAVGPKTAHALRTVGCDPEGEEAGKAADLASVIANKSHSHPLLFICSNRRRPTLPEGLRGAGVAFEELVVYETHPRSDLQLGARDTDWLALFSPSGVEALEQSEGVDIRQIHRAAIGPTTASALRNRGLPVAAVADEPTPAGLLTAIESVR